MTKDRRSTPLGVFDSNFDSIMQVANEMNEQIDEEEE